MSGQNPYLDRSFLYIPALGLGAMEQDDRRTYRSRRRQALISASIVALYAATFSIIFEPDPVTHLKPLPGDYLWQVVPFGIFTAVLAIRAFQVRLVTTPIGLTAYRVVGHESMPWAVVEGFERHTSPTGRTVAVVMRHSNGRSLRLMSFWLRKEDGGRSPRAEALLAELEADRTARVERLTHPVWAG
jgi:hypothetical protein